LTFITKSPLAGANDIPLGAVSQQCAKRPKVL
jgi:hypothetical protein